MKRSGRNGSRAAATVAVSARRDVGPRPGDDGDFIEHQGRVLDEHGIRQVGRLRQPADGAAERRQGGLVGPVLGAGPVEVDRRAGEVGQFAAGDATG